MTTSAATEPNMSSSRTPRRLSIADAICDGSGL